jgi:pantothenate kinase type III
MAKTYPFVLTIDHGNTHSKMVLYCQQKITWIGSLVSYQEFRETIFPRFALIKTKIGSAPVDEEILILISRTGASSPLLETYRSHFTSLKKYFNHQKFFDMPVSYSQTLGEDRLYSAYFLYQQALQDLKAPIVLVSCGTFITIDYINHQGLLGGPILLGPRAYLKGFNASEDLARCLGDEKMRTLERPYAKVEELPHATKEAILQGTSRYLAGIFSSLSLPSFEKAQIIFTGGAFAECQTVIESLPFFQNHFLSVGKELPFYDKLVNESLFYLSQKISSSTRSSWEHPTASANANLGLSAISNLNSYFNEKTYGEDDAKIHGRS